MDDRCGKDTGVVGRRISRSVRAISWFALCTVRRSPIKHPQRMATSIAITMSPGFVIPAIVILFSPHSYYGSKTRKVVDVL